MRTTANHVAECIQLSGIKTMFAYPGQSNLLLLEAVRRAGIRLVVTADERSAGFAATGYIRTTGTPAIVSASKGPGVTNLLSPLASAKADGVPLVALTCNVGMRSFGHN